MTGCGQRPYPGPVDEAVRTVAEVMLTTPVRHPLPSPSVRFGTSSATIMSMLR